MMLLIKRLLRLTPPESVNKAEPTLRVVRNDPGKPRVRHGSAVARLRKQVPPL